MFVFFGHQIPQFTQMGYEVDGGIHFPVRTSCSDSGTLCFQNTLITVASAADRQMFSSMSPLTQVDQTINFCLVETNTH